MGGSVGGRDWELSSMVDCFEKNVLSNSAFSRSVVASMLLSIRVGIVEDTCFVRNCLASLNHVLTGVVLSLTLSIILLS